MKCRIETGRTFAKMARRRLCMSQRLYMVSVSESWHENTSALSAGQICMDISVSTKAMSPLCKRQWTAKNLKGLQIKKRLEVYDAAVKEASLWEWKLYRNKLDSEAIKQILKLKDLKLFSNKFGPNPGRARRPFCVECACFPRDCVGCLPPQSKDIQQRWIRDTKLSIGLSACMYVSPLMDWPSIQGVSPTCSQRCGHLRMDGRKVLYSETTRRQCPHVSYTETVPDAESASRWWMALGTSGLPTELQEYFPFVVLDCSEKRKEGPHSVEDVPWRTKGPEHSRSWEYLEDKICLQEHNLAAVASVSVFPGRRFRTLCMFSSPTSQVGDLEHGCFWNGE